MWHFAPIKNPYPISSRLRIGLKLTSSWASALFWMTSAASRFFCSTSNFFDCSEWQCFNSFWSSDAVDSEVKISLWYMWVRSRSYKTFFSFGVKLGHFTINNFFLYVTKMQAYQQKMEKFFVSEEKKVW